MAIKHVLRKLVNWVLSDDAEKYYHDTAVKSSGNYGNKVSRIGESASGLNLTIYSAIGGKVVQFTTYDPIRDKTTGGLYIVTDQEDLGEEIGQIITREQLSR
jgi:hypothetical protein